MDPSIVVLDEATSSLDSQEELRLQAAIHALLKGRSAIIIAHRLSTIRDCDRVVVLEAGRLVEQGPPAELLAEEGSFYARLHRSHFSSVQLDA
jgi:ABC-type multidrug transport system fused ATPase/permease subunit